MNDSLNFLETFNDLLTKSERKGLEDCWQSIFSIEPIKQEENHQDSRTSLSTSLLEISSQVVQFEVVKELNSKQDNLDNEIYYCTRIGCDKLYKNKENLKLHIKNVHEHIKPFKCNFCDKRFSHRNGKIYHERKAHTLELPYNCIYPECKCKFPSKSAMIAHNSSIHLMIKRNRSRKGSKEIIKAY